MPDIILAICYQANREPTPDELGGFKDTAEDSLPDHYTNSAGLQLNYLWAEADAVRPDTPVSFFDTNARRAKVLEAARAFAAVTAGLENTKEGAALLRALKQLDAMNG